MRDYENIKFKHAVEYGSHQCELLDVEAIGKVEIGPEYDTPFGPSPDVVNVVDVRIKSVRGDEGFPIEDRLAPEVLRELKIRARRLLIKEALGTLREDELNGD